MDCGNVSRAGKLKWLAGKTDRDVAQSVLALNFALFKMFA
jgi:hypothetical protein